MYIYEYIYVYELKTIIIITVSLQWNVDNYRWVIYNAAELLLVGQEYGNRNTIPFSHMKKKEHEKLQLENGEFAIILSEKIAGPIYSFGTDENIFYKASMN